MVSRTYEIRLGTIFSFMRPSLIHFVADFLDGWNLYVINPWLPVELFRYATILYFWFYTYH
jgi:hypothetical protein